MNRLRGAGTKMIRRSPSFLAMCGRLNLLVPMLCATYAHGDIKSQDRSLLKLVLPQYLPV